MVVTSEMVLADAERLAQLLSNRYAPGAQPWTHAVTLWANAQPARVRHWLHDLYSHHRANGEPAGPELSEAVIAVLAAADRAWAEPNSRPARGKRAG